MLALGLDIGGANLKAATSAGVAHAEPFDLWRAPWDLAARLRELMNRLPRPDVVAMTMTAELADCFATKAEGVADIVAAAQEAAGAAPLRIWQTTGEFATPERARKSPRTVAAGNWHALATWAGRLAPRGKSLLIDIGSTTTDVIPLCDGRPCSEGLTDLDRLLNHELVYSGIRRTPLCALAQSVLVRGRTCATAAELFATTLDVYLLLGLIPENPDDRHTADERPATVACAHDRLARMVCCDRDEIDLVEARRIAHFFAEAQEKVVSAAIEAVVGRDAKKLDAVVVAGSGESLALKILAEHPATRNARLIRLAKMLSPDLAEAACAYAVAVLATENG
jgi:probable H4MPT-linked C1 transfer pathway protein